MTLFEKIAAGQIPAKLVYQDDRCIAFHDINQQAPVHILITPRKAIVRIAEATDEDEAVLGHLLLVARDIAKAVGVVSGYRLVINNGQDAGESVPHLHVHLLAGRKLNWPPG
jgi:histidine triad (HIT) family protein